MTNTKHDDTFGDDLANIFNGPAPKTATTAPAGYVAPTTFVNITRTSETYTETCAKCRGTGEWRSWSGHTSGQCFACKGKGKLTYKSTAASRAKARETSQLRKATKEAEKVCAFKDANPAVWAWLEKNPAFEFASSLRNAIAKWGYLTEKQTAAVNKLMARDADRKAQAQARIDNAASIDVSKIEAAFATARTNAKAFGAMGIRWLKLRLDTFLFLDAPAKGEWAAAILVREGDKKLGRIANGKFVRSFACDDPTEARVLAVAADPQAAAIAYGQKFSSCAICGRELTDPESIQRSIGPICAAKFGWA